MSLDAFLQLGGSPKESYKVMYFLRDSCCKYGQKTEVDDVRENRYENTRGGAVRKVPVAKRTHEEWRAGHSITDGG